jgi:hypothetical protein
MTMQQESLAKGPVAYCTAQLDIYHDDPAAHIGLTGCVLNPDSTLVVLAEGPETVQFNVTVPLAYGDGQSELAEKVADALQATYGVTGLTDVKFIPAL